MAADAAPRETSGPATHSPAQKPRKGSFLGKVGRGTLLLLKIALPTAILGGAYLGYQYMEATKPPVKRIAVKERVHHVETVTANRSTVAPTLVLYGKIVAGRKVELRPLVSGRVVKVGNNFADGGIVKKGDLLVEIDAFEYRIAVTEKKAQLTEATARLTELEAELKGEKSLIAQDREQLELRKRDVARREALMRRGAGTEKLLDDAKLALSSQQQRYNERLRRVETLGAKLIQQKAAIARAEAAVIQAERNLRDTKLLAPFKGFLSDISTEIGKKIGVNDKIAQLTDSGRFEAQFQVSDAQYGRLVSGGDVIGKAATVVWKTSGRNFSFPAKIARVSGWVTSDTGGVNLFAKLDPTTSETLLRPGVFVEVRITDRPFKNVFRLPDDAVHGGTLVYVVENERLARRKVTVVGRVGNDVLVRGNIENGDKVVARTFPEIGPGLKVSVPSSSARNTPRNIQ